MWGHCFELEPHNLHLKIIDSLLLVYSYNPSTRDTDTGKCLRLQANLFSLCYQVTGQWETLCQKKYMNSEKWHSRLSSGHHMNLYISICESTLNTHIYTHTDIHRHIHIHRHMQTMHTHTYTHVDTHTHTHKHIDMLSLKFWKFHFNTLLLLCIGQNWIGFRWKFKLTNKVTN